MRGFVGLLPPALPSLPQRLPEDFFVFQEQVNAHTAQRQAVFNVPRYGGGSNDGQFDQLAATKTGFDLW